MRTNRNETVCWICDYWLVLLAILIVIIIAVMQVSGRIPLPPAFIPSPPISVPLVLTLPVHLPTISSPTNLPGSTDTVPPTTSSLPPTPTPESQTSSHSTATPLPQSSSTPTHEIESQTSSPSTTTPQSQSSFTSTPTIESQTSSPSLATLEVQTFTPSDSTPTAGKKQTYILAFIPLKWKESADKFFQVAHERADFFIKSSNLDKYFDVSVVVLDKGPENVSLSADDLLDKVIEFGVKNQPADRYIGLTDGDIVAGGSSQVTGWTYGPNTLGVVAESEFPETTAHELGHTFGLCDEYNYSYWKSQNEEFKGGCPNPYPATCPKDNTGGGVQCTGTLSDSGQYSIMGPSGMGTDYGYNHESYSHLQDIFVLLNAGH